MALYALAPGVLDLVIVYAEPWSMNLTINRNLTGYTVTAALQANSGIEVPMTVEVVSGASSTVNLSLSDAEVTSLSLGIMNWYMRWVPLTGLERTILAGKVSVERVR